MKVKPVKLTETVLQHFKEQLHWITKAGIDPQYLEPVNDKAIFKDTLYGRYLVFYRTNGSIDWCICREDDIR